MRSSRNTGFTMVELVVIILIVGILAVATLPRFFETSVFEARGFYDEVLAALRYAHKTAIAQRRPVHMEINGAAETFAACYTSVFPCSGANRVPGPNGETPFSFTAPSGVDLGATATFFFSSLGRPYNSTDPVPTDASSASTFTTLTIPITGGNQTRTITVERESGYVH